MYKRFKVRTYRLLNPKETDSIGRSIDVFIISLISVSILAVVLESDRNLARDYARPFLLFEWFSSITFTVEYVLRLWTCTCDERYRHPIKGRLRYMVSFMAIVDLVAILPFYLPMLIEMDLRVVRAIRLLRLFRLFKIGRYADSIRNLAEVFARKKEEFAIVFFMVIMTLIVSSSVMYFAEHEAQPEKFFSIPAAMWWGVITLTTVGYGDVYPVTSLGKFVGGIIALLGVGIVALPAGIVASGFGEAVTERNAKKAEVIAEKKAAKERAAENREPPSCPHCGKALPSPTP